MGAIRWTLAHLFSTSVYLPEYVNPLLCLYPDGRTSCLYSWILACLPDPRHHHPHHQPTTCLDLCWTHISSLISPPPVYASAPSQNPSFRTKLFKQKPGNCPWWRLAALCLQSADHCVCFQMSPQPPSSQPRPPAFLVWSVPLPLNCVPISIHAPWTSLSIPQL